MESVSFLSTTNSPLTQFLPLPRKSSSSSCSSRLRIACSVRADPWSLSDGDPRRPKPRSMNPKNPLSDDNARRIIKGKAAYLSRLRRNQGPAAHTPLWIKRSPEQMVQHLNDHRHGHLYGRHVVAAIALVRSLSRLRRYDMRSVMVSFAGKLSFREMCVVLKEQKGWRQVQEFFAWMKLQLSYHPSVVAYTIVLRAYGQAGKIELAEQTFLEMLEAGLEPDQVACGTMLCSYARWGRHGPMLSFHSAVRQRGLLLSLPVYNFMLSSLHKKSLHRHVTQLWAHMADQPLLPNAFTYAVVIGSLFRQADCPAALRAFDEMRAVGIVPEEVTYCHLITLATQSAKWSDALMIYGDMRDQRIAPSSHTCASLLTLFYKTQDYSAALSLFSEMGRRKIPADQVIYGLLIRIYGKLGLYDDARKAFEETRQLGILTHEKTYLAMAQVHLNSGDSQKALQVLDLMKSSQIPFSRFGYIVQLQCYVMAKDLTSAESTFQALQSHTGLADAGSCNDMLHLYLGLGLVDKARDFAARIRKDGVVFNEELCKTVIRVYFKEGMVNDAKQLVEEMSTTESLANNTFIQTISSQSKGDRRSVVGDQPDTVALGFVISMHLAEGNVNKTEKVLRELLDTTGGASVASQLVNNFIREGDALKAETVMNQLRKLGCRSDDATVAYVINMYGKQQKVKRAEQVFLEFADSAAAKMSLCRSMLDVYVKCGKPDEAYSLYQKVSAEAGQSLDAVAISIVVNASSNTGKHREAETMIRKTLEDHAELDTVAYNTFIKAMLHAGRLHFATSIFEHMLSLDVTPSIQTYNTMISVYGRGRKLDKATEVFNSACEAGLPVDEKAYMNLISHYGKGGKRREASLLFSEMLEKGIKPGMVSYNIMMNVLGIGGFHEEAEKLVKGMERDGHVPDSLTYLSLVRAYTESHKYSEAEATIDSMCEKGVTASSAHYNVLISALAKAGLMEEAERVYERVVLEDGVLNCCRSMVRGYLDYGHVQRGIEFIEGLRAEEDRFIMSSAVHFYSSAGMEDKAAAVLESTRQLRMSFLDNLKVGSKLS